jgi:hypothetical protein
MRARYRVVNRLGVFVAGQRLSPGGEVSLDNDVAAPLVAAGAIERASEPAKAPSRRRQGA